MRRFVAVDCFGNRWEFVGRSWRNGGFSVNERGEPTRDSQGIMITDWADRALDTSPKCARLLVEAWAGEERVGRLDRFLNWLLREADVSRAVAAACLKESVQGIDVDRQTVNLVRLAGRWIQEEGTEGLSRARKLLGCVEV